MIRVAKLHGGPNHGGQVTLQPGQTLVYVLRARPGSLERARDPEATPIDAEIDTQTGVYSPVSGSPGDYEWDGWK